MQKYTSKATSVNQVARFYKQAIKMEILGNAEQVFDYGCGRYLQKINDYAGTNNFCVIGYDPYNRPNQENVLAMLDVSRCNLVCCNNVLNVLTDDALLRVVFELKGLSTICNGPVYVTVYEGDRTGNGKVSKADCYQRNMKTRAYVPVLSKVFKSVQIKNNIIICE